MRILFFLAGAFASPILLEPYASTVVISSTAATTAHTNINTNTRDTSSAVPMSACKPQIAFKANNPNTDSIIPNLNPTATPVPKNIFKPNTTTTATPQSCFSLMTYTNASFCLGADSSKASRVLLLPCSDRRTTLLRTGDGMTFQKSFCLDVTDGLGADLQAWTCVDNANQGFKWVRESTTVAIRETVTWKGRCMGVDKVVEGARVRMMPCNGGMKQMWIGLESHGW
ncbi:hypothetical protein CspHIS471_0702540 [Cutaneotrichosporon sp. HIS471]|nr:hypothetical protein CspHIS471_0702540 [Cutaneotrichosporon sp. HIS471]